MSLFSPVLKRVSLLHIEMLVYCKNIRNNSVFFALYNKLASIHQIHKAKFSFWLIVAVLYCPGKLQMRQQSSIYSPHSICRKSNAKDKYGVLVMVNNSMRFFKVQHFTVRQDPPGTITLPHLIKANSRDHS